MRTSENRCGKKVNVDIADTSPHKASVLYKEKRFFLGSRCEPRQRSQQSEDFRAVAQAATSQFADDEIVATDLSGFQQGRHRWVADSKVLNPDRRIDQYHGLTSRRRGMDFTFGSLPPRLANRRALS